MPLKRILIVDTYYPEFVRTLYAQRPELQTLPYQAQLTAFIQQRFGTSDYYSRHLTALGYDTQDVLANNTIVQWQWAKEHHITVHHWPNLPYINRLTNRLLLYKILRAQIAEFRPDILYMQNLSFCDPLTLHSLKKHISLLVGQIASPLPPTPFIKPYDLILTSFPHFVERIRALGPDSEYLKIGFDESILTALQPVPDKMYDVVFIGGFTQVHSAATQALETLAKQVRVDVWGYGIEHLAADSPLRRHYHGEAWGMEMYRIIQQAKICINRHSAAAEQYANNMRLYETTGVGTLLITDAKENLNDLFTVDKEVVSYHATSELVKKVSYYLQHIEERERIAAAGQQRTLRDHSYQQRMIELSAIFSSYKRRLDHHTIN